MQRVERALELKYWEYLEFYMNVLSKAIHLSTTEQFNPFIVFHDVSVQQMYPSFSALTDSNAIQEVVDTVDAYCLPVVGIAAVCES